MSWDLGSGTQARGLVTYMLLTVWLGELGFGLWDPSGALVMHMLLTVGLGELGFGLWDPSGRFGMIYVSNSRVRGVGIWALGPNWEV